MIICAGGGGGRSLFSFADAISVFIADACLSGATRGGGNLFIFVGLFGFIGVAGGGGGGVFVTFISVSHDRKPYIL